MSSTNPDAEGAPSARNGVQVISRAAQILRALEANPEGLSLAQIAERVGLARSTVHRIVQALAAERLLVYASPTGGVRLGPGLANLAAAARRELRHELHPFLVRLSEQIDETVDLAVLEGDRVLFVDQAAVPRRLAAVSFVGATFPAHCTANGKALLATLSDERLGNLLPRRLERHTPSTLTDRGSLLRELRTVREQGFAFDREEHTVGICAVGAVVRDQIGPLAAVTTPLPAARFYGREDALAAAVVGACAEMSKVLASV